jgi:glutamate synthase (NADPH/NADH) small chain
MHDINLSLQKTPVLKQSGFTESQALLEARRCLACPGRYCAASCPIHTPVTEFIAKIREKDYDGALCLIKENNCMPQVTCRVCAQERQCEKNCTRGIKGEPVAIGALERFAVENGVSQKPISLEQSKGRVAILGSGPAGLSCAYSLALEGYKVDIFEARDYPGGVLAWGIPDFILPRESLDSFLSELDDLGVTIHCGKKISGDQNLHNLFSQGFSAIFVATGSGTEKRLDLPGAESVFTSSEFLETANINPGILQGKFKSIAVIGGGDTAVDAARAALRIGAEKVTLIYRRSRLEMGASRKEIEMAEEEGVDFKFLALPQRILPEGVKCAAMRLTEPSFPGGRRNTEAILGEDFVVEAEAVVSALGFAPSEFEGLDVDAKGYLKVGKRSETRIKGVFAGGDAAGSAKSIAAALQSGKLAADCIEEYLGKA